MHGRPSFLGLLAYCWFCFVNTLGGATHVSLGQLRIYVKVTGRSPQELDFWNANDWRKLSCVIAFVKHWLCLRKVSCASAKAAAGKGFKNMGKISPLNCVVDSPVTILPLVRCTGYLAMGTSLSNIVTVNCHMSPPLFTSTSSGSAEAATHMKKPQTHPKCYMGLGSCQQLQNVARRAEGPGKL